MDAADYTRMHEVEAFRAWAATAPAGDMTDEDRAIATDFAMTNANDTPDADWMEIAKATFAMYADDPSFRSW